MLRLLGRTVDISQRDLATRLGAAPSRVVTLIDELEERGFVQRRRSLTDRRNYELRLTREGTAILRQLREVAEAHEQATIASLTVKQVAQLAALLQPVAATLGVEPDIHPGYRASLDAADAARLDER